MTGFTSEEAATGATAIQQSVQSQTILGQPGITTKKMKMKSMKMLKRMKQLPRS